MITQAFKDFIESKVEHKFLTLNNFYRDRLYLSALAEYFYGAKASEVGSCIFTKDGNYLRSSPSDTDVFWTRHNTVLFEPKQTVIFFDSEEAVELYKQLLGSSGSSNYNLSKDEIFMILDDDYSSKINEVKKIIEDYRAKLSLHQSRVDYLEQIRIDLRNAAKLENQVSLIEDLLDAANDKLASTKFKFEVNEVISKDLILDHEGGDVYDIHFIFDDKKTILSKRSSDREKINEWMKDVLDRLNFYSAIADRFESKLIDLNRHELTVSLKVNQDLTAKVNYFKNSRDIETFVDQIIESSKIVINENVTVKLHDAEEVYFTYRRQSELSELEEVLRDINDSYVEYIVDQKGTDMKSFKLTEIEEAIKYIRHLDVEEQFDDIKIDQNARSLIIKSDQLKEQKCISLRWDDTEDILITDNLEKYLHQKSKFLYAFKYLKDLVDKSSKLEHDYAEKEEQARVLIEDIDNGKDYAFILELDENRETLVSVCLKVERYKTNFFETRVFQSEEKMHLVKVKEMLDKFEAALKQKGIYR